jgi:itaconate CoA-transferase
MPGPLNGIVVVALEQAVAAPFASRQLSDMGARVIKIERPKVGDFARSYDNAVDGMASHFVWVNRNKESLALDFTQPDGREVLDKLISQADVFIQNLSPTTARRRGLDATHLSEHFNELIACDISGYGDGGPYASRRAYDLLIQAEAASITTTGWPDHPAKPGVAIADLAAGIYAYSSILAALYERKSTGRGRAIAVSLFDSLAEWMGYSIHMTGGSGLRHVPNGVSHPTLAPYGDFDTADGRKIVLGVQNDREWSRLAKQVLERTDLVEHPKFATNAARVQNRELVEMECSRAISKLTTDEAISVLDHAGIACGRVNYSEELVEHPQLKARDRWRSVDSPRGPIQALLPPPVSAGWEMRMDRIPAVGEHSRAILAELNYGPGAITDLVNLAIISEPESEQ